MDIKGCARSQKKQSGGVNMSAPSCLCIDHDVGPAEPITTAVVSSLCLCWYMYSSGTQVGWAAQTALSDTSEVQL